MEPGSPFLPPDPTRPTNGMSLLGFGNDFFKYVAGDAGNSIQSMLDSLQSSDPSQHVIPRSTDSPDNILQAALGGLGMSGQSDAGIASIFGGSPVMSLLDHSMPSWLKGSNVQIGAAPTVSGGGTGPPTSSGGGSGGGSMVSPGTFGDDLVPYQFGDTSLSHDEAYAACGPAAAVAFARLNGRNPTLREALDLAKQTGWTAQGGMNGMQNEATLLQKMGITARADYATSEQKIQAVIQAGGAAIISTGHHYYVADGYDPATGKYHVGASGRAIIGGGNWMSAQDMQSKFGGDPIDGALYLDKPPEMATAAQGAVTSGDPESKRATILSMAEQHSGKEFAMVINGVLNLEGALNGSVGDNGASFGPFQFYKGGELSGFAHSLGVSPDQAQAMANDPKLAARYAFTYLHPVYEDGKRLGLSGAQLLYYVQVKGQRSVPPSNERLAAAWGDSVRRYGG